MISVYIIMAIVALLLLGFIIGLYCYIQSIRVGVLSRLNASDYPKSMIAVSESKVIEMPARKQKFPLVIFKDGKKVVFKLKK